MTNDTVAKTVEPTDHRRERTRASVVYRPNVDIVETPEELLLKADLPGVNPAELDLRFENGELLVQAPAAQRQPAETRYLAREYGVGDFRCRFEVAETIDASAISASYQNGVLTLRLPKIPAARPRKIPVVAAN